MSPRVDRQGGPILKVLDGGGEAPPLLTGESVLREIADLIDRHLPSVSLDDPERVALQALRLACSRGGRR